MYERLLRAEVYAYERWMQSGYVSSFWYGLAAALCKRVKAIDGQLTLPFLGCMYKDVTGG